MPKAAEGELEEIPRKLLANAEILPSKCRDFAEETEQTPRMPSKRRGRGGEGEHGQGQREGLQQPCLPAP